MFDHSLVYYYICTTFQLLQYYYTFSTSYITLIGTRCSKSPHKVCHEGICQAKPNVPEPSPDMPKWSPWSQYDSCQSGCILSTSGPFQGPSQGYQKRSRFCIYPPQAPAATAGGCPGPAIQVRTCGNFASCNAYHSPNDFASKACQTYMDKNTRLSLSLLPEGKQMSYSSRR